MFIEIKTEFLIEFLINKLIAWSGKTSPQLYFNLFKIFVFNAKLESTSYKID